MLSRWYRDPVSINWIYPDSLDACCAVTEREDYLHIWWGCDHIRPFWKRIFQICNEIYDKSLVPSPKTALLSILPGSVKSHKSSLLQFFLSAACQLISRFWKTDTTPPLNLWQDLINDTMFMEEMQARESDNWEKHNKLWGVWIYYSNSDLF